MTWLEEFAKEIFVGLVIFAITSVLTVVFRRRVRLFLRRRWYYLSNKQVAVSVTLVRKYAGPMMKPISHQVFQVLKSKLGTTDSLTLRSVTEETLSVTSEKLSLDLELQFAPEHDETTLDIESPKIIDYKLVVRPRTSMRWGRREMDDLTLLALVMDKMAESAETLCLKQGEQPIQEFVLVDYRQDRSPVGRTPEELRDKDLDIQLTVQENTVRAVLESTQRLVLFARRNIPS